MGGRLVAVGARNFEYNTETCPVCYATVGRACARLDFDRGRGGSKRETHRAEAKRLGIPFPFTEQWKATQRRKRQKEERQNRPAQKPKKRA
ncbi:hypothetical protein SAMN04488590_3253 [Microbacterium sp. 77mftsu3.1]|nr:hypothetical protein SAMN04488590_3253 [Microbacterium sp. 77mftsu3.1]